MSAALHVDPVRDLMEARRTGRPLVEPPAVSGLTEAYALQAAHLAALTAAHPGARVVGYKAGATNEAGQNRLGLSGPFFAPLLSTQVGSSPASLPAGRFFHRIVEVEIAFRLGADLRPRPGARHIARSEIVASIAAAMPSIEVADSRYADWTTASGTAAIADLGYSGAWIHGPDIADWTSLDLPGLRAVLHVDGEAVREGRGSAVLGDPLVAVEQLALHLRAHGQVLRAGDIVTTGSMTQAYVAAGPCLLRAAIEGFTDVTVQLT